MNSCGIQSDSDLRLLALRLENRKKPFTVSVRDGMPRTTRQNALQRKWCTEVSEQLGDRTPEQVRGYMKLHHGIPIRREDPEFDAAYRDRIIGLTYEMKMALMMEPFDLAVTRDMTRKQLSRYLDAVMGDFTQQGVVLTMPEGDA